MEKPFILHMFTTAKNLSPFDVNMALDAGWTSVIPYVNVELGEIGDLTQDAIFSRGPKGVRRTGIFIGGRDSDLAMDMLEACRKSMVPPFEVSVFADPSGAFTTAAGMVAAVERQLAQVHKTDLKNKNVLCLAGTGPVGAAAAVLAAKAGAKVKIIGRQLDKSQKVAQTCNERYGDNRTGIEGGADADKDSLMQTADVVFATAKAGIQILSEAQVKAAPRLLAAADVNAVPPPGIAGLDAFADGKPLPGSGSGAVGIGALAIGNVKYQAQQRLLKRMVESDKPVYLHFEHAFELARQYVRENTR